MQKSAAEEDLSAGLNSCDSTHTQKNVLVLFVLSAQQGLLDFSGVRICKKISTKYGSLDVITGHHFFFPICTLSQQSPFIRRVYNAR